MVGGQARSSLAVACDNSQKPTMLAQLLVLIEPEARPGFTLHKRVLAY